jgi:hypothetical protein
MHLTRDETIEILSKQDMANMLDAYDDTVEHVRDLMERLEGEGNDVADELAMILENHQCELRMIIPMVMVTCRVTAEE